MIGGGGPWEGKSAYVIYRIWGVVRRGYGESPEKSRGGERAEARMRRVEARRGRCVSDRLSDESVLFLGDLESWIGL
jgi:hypothetical protein